MLALVLTLSLFACSGVPDTVSTGTVAPSAPVEQPLGLTASTSYAVVGTLLTFTATGGGEGEASFSYPTDGSVGAPQQEGDRLTLRALGTGN